MKLTYRLAVAIENFPDVVYTDDLNRDIDSFQIDLEMFTGSEEFSKLSAVAQADIHKRINHMNEVNRLDSAFASSSPMRLRHIKGVIKMLSAS